MSRVHRNLALTLIIVLLIFALPATVFAQEGGGHDHNPSADTSAPAAGPLSWAFLGFGAVIIATVSIVLFTGNRGDDHVIAADFDELTGFSGYIGKMRLFSRNARLYMVHIVGMDVIHGTWRDFQSLPAGLRL